MSAAGEEQTKWDLKQDKAAEVKPIDFMKFCPNIPKDVEYPTKVNQKPLMQAQKEWYLPVLDEFDKAGVMRDIRSDEVKVVHPTVLAQKAHGVLGLTIEEIQWTVEDQCVAHGKLPNPNLPPQPQSEMDTPSEATPAKLKWQVTNNFSSINRVSKLAPMPQGDIRVKQQCLAGHKYTCVIDFASRFYAIEVDKEDQPYLCIYVEGLGYKCYY
ncbi:hypothetical protein PAXRUDRAFT_16657 [Paxillus rubicundulus Ve08.2h10]|uniref:Uncharacterized protein n=1 Tax=Paxillus rubicundulus Ve08.2h10 TaxID=930991 RepID=A0A0D0C730_9AGAM|nr:hypothetical protein PAXRUDRAFT_16657 [Paxillus rubicundulus Ve08.2h10]